MRVILDTNVIVSGMIAPRGAPGIILDQWYGRQFNLLISEEQIGEFRNTMRKPNLLNRISRARLGRLINDLREFGVHVPSYPQPRRSSDPSDDFLLAMSEFGKADFLVTGDKSHLLDIARHHQTQIVSARRFLNQFSKSRLQ